MTIVADVRKKTKEELIQDLLRAHARIAELEHSAAGKEPGGRSRPDISRLRESEGRYHTAIEHSNDSAAILRGLTVVYVNRRFLEIFGYSSADQVADQSIEIVVHPDDRERVIAYILSRQNHREPSKCSFTGARKDGTAVYVEASGTKTMLSGDPVTLVYLRDVTERKQAQDALQARVRAEALVSSISARFITAKTHNADMELENTLRSIGEFTGADTAYLLLFTEDGSSLEKRLEWSRDGAEPAGTSISLLLTPEWIKEKLRHTDVLRVPGPDHWPHHGGFEKWRQKAAGTPSLLGVPLIMNRHMIGFMAFSARSTEKRWNEEDVVVLRLASEILSSVLNRQRMEEALRLNEARTKALLNAIPDTMYRIRTDGIILDIKLDHKRHAGPADPVIGQSITDTSLPNETSTHILSLIRQAVETGRIRRYEFDLPVAHEVRIFEARIVKSGKDEAVCIIRNVTERREAEQALRESESKFRSIAEQSMVGVYLFQDDQFKYVNDQFAQILGYRAEEVLGKSPLAFVRPEDQVLAEENIRKRLSGEVRAIGYEFTGIRKDGELVYLETYGVRTMYRSRPAIVGSVIDRTEGKRLEAQLIQAEKMKAIGALAGGIAHDFNNLLMSIQGYTSLMLHNMGPGELHYGKLKGIEELVESGSELTKQLLTFASGGTYEIRQADLNEIVRKTSAMFARTRKEVSIRCVFDGSPCVVDVDAPRIEQILLNLYVNAWQAMPGGGTLFLETSRVALDRSFVKPYSLRPGKYAKVSVTDTGEGMDHQTKERIFEPFFTTKKMGRGTGIGLASVYSVVKGHQGIINVHSEKGCGTSFHIYLPLSKKVLEKPSPVSAEVVEGNGTILIVDDEESVIAVSRDMLEMLGYSVLVARSGREAVEVYERNCAVIDLVILDMVMPDMGGEETFVLLKGINPAVVVVLSSGYSLDGLATKIMNEGCKAFIQKPFTINTLSQRLAEVLGRLPSNN